MKEKPKDIKERTFEFAVRIVKLCQQLDKNPGVPRTLSGQLLRAGTSVGANMEEAQAGQSKADFISKTSVALEGGSRMSLLAAIAGGGWDYAGKETSRPQR